MDFVEWIPTCLCICASTWRSLNLGYQKEAYLASATGQVFFIFDTWHDRKKVVLNIFYLMTALIGAKNWWKEEKKEMKKLQ